MRRSRKKQDKNSRKKVVERLKKNGYKKIKSESIKLKISNKTMFYLMTCK